MFTTIPLPPGPDWVFQPPPSWNAPVGFDPRHGDLLDPTWTTPPGWTFWIPPQRPRSEFFTVDGLRARPGRILITVIGITLLIVSVVTIAHRVDTANGVGSCWSPSSTTTTLSSVSCKSPIAQYRATSEVSDPSQCPTSTTIQRSPTDYLCLVINRPVSEGSTNDIPG